MTKRLWVLAALALFALLDFAWWWSLCNDCGPREMLYPWKMFGIGI